jgi:hypothetical protein
MARGAKVTGDLSVTGTLSTVGFNPPAGCIDNAAVDADAAIAASKLQHQYAPNHKQLHGTAVAAKREPIHIVVGTTGEIIDFWCALAVACVGDSTITVNLKKNGSNILSAATVLDSSNVAFAKEEAAGFSSVAVVAGDVLEVDVTVSAGTGTLGQGLIAQLIVQELVD